jgi:peroxiredoxin
MVVAMANQPHRISPMPTQLPTQLPTQVHAPTHAPTHAPPFAAPSLAASAVWPRLRGDGPVRAVAVVFLGVDCPASAAVLPRLSRVHATWGELGVRVVGIVVGSQVTPAQAAQFRAAHRLRFPLMTDRSGALRQLLSPTHTPEVFVLGPDGAVAYHGRIDDDVPPPEQLPQSPRVHIEEALSAVVAGRAPAVRHTAPVGRPLMPYRSPVTP